MNTMALVRKSLFGALAVLVLAGCNKDLLVTPEKAYPVRIQLQEPTAQEETIRVTGLESIGAYKFSAGALGSESLKELTATDFTLEPASPFKVPKGADVVDFNLKVSKNLAGKGLLLLIYQGQDTGFNFSGIISLVVRGDGTVGPATPAPTAAGGKDIKGVKTPIGGGRKP